MNTFLMRMNGENHAFWVRPSDGRIINRARMGTGWYNMDTEKTCPKRADGGWSIAGAMGQLQGDGFEILDSELDRIEAFQDMRNDDEERVKRYFEAQAEAHAAGRGFKGGEDW